jgi:hypothetical protein
MLTVQSGNAHQCLGKIWHNYSSPTKQAFSNNDSNRQTQSLQIFALLLVDDGSGLSCLDVDDNILLDALQFTHSELTLLTKLVSTTGEMAIFAPATVEENQRVRLDNNELEVRLQQHPIFQNQRSKFRQLIISRLLGKRFSITAKVHPKNLTSSARNTLDFLGDCVQHENMSMFTLGNAQIGSLVPPSKLFLKAVSISQFDPMEETASLLKYLSSGLTLINN